MLPCHKHGLRYIPWFSAWQEYSPVIPKMYYDVESAEQRMHAVCAQLHKLVCFADMLGDKISINHDEIVELQNLFQQFMESGFEDYYEEQIEAWINAHMENIIIQAVKMVFFGLSDDGHFIAYIPSSWNEIIFDTGYDYSDENTYGHLILKMYVTDTFQINGNPTDLIWEVNNNG